MITVDWKDPSTVPEVALGTEKNFWIAVQHNDGKITICHALYQNRPLVDEEHELYDDCLNNTDGEAVESIGWVEDKVHCEFDNFYEPFDFDDERKLVGWAEYELPEFSKHEGLPLMPFDFFTLDSVFSNVHEMPSRGFEMSWSVLDERGTHMGIIALSASGEMSIEVDNFPAQRKYYSTSIPGVTLSSFFKDVTRCGLSLKKRITSNTQTRETV